MIQKNCTDLLREFKEKNKITIFKTGKLTFIGVDGKDVYNITAPFQSGGKTVIAGRVEQRDSEYSSVIFFEEKNNKYIPIEGALKFQLQDPFFTKFKGDLILGGVEVYPNPENLKTLAWRTIYYQGKDIYSLKKVSQGPDKMKDLRIVELEDEKIGVFTRPQGNKGGRGKIGYIEIKDLKELSDDKIYNAPLLNQFFPEEWGGVNEIHLLNNGKLGILSHIASFDEDQITRHYYPTVFCFDPKTKEYTHMELIGYRDLFKPGESKRPDLKDVVFSGGIIRKEGNKAILYAGIGDAEAHWLEIKDPFTKWE